MGTGGAKEKKEGKTSPKDDKKPRNEILNEENKKDEANTGHKGVPIKISIKVMKSICKITIKYKSKEKKNKTGKGFFMKISDSLNYLITNYHVINPKETDEIIEIEIHNQKNMTLNLENRNIIYIEKPKDITAIEIKETDEIYDDIEFLNYDMNYKHNGYSMYKGADILTVGHPNGDDAACASGTIVEIYDYEFDHNISTEDGSSGSPIILLNNNINLIQVIGIHKNADNITKLNGGTFIGELFKEINFNSEKNDKANESQIKLKKEKSLNKNNENNYIIAGIYINDKDINKDIRIINSYEEWMRKNYPKDELKEKYMNEKEINKCKIKINELLIPFNYFHQFNQKGYYTIKYSFINNLTNMNYMFSKCSSLENINLSNFNTQNVIDMYRIFSECSSLKNIDLSNFNTQNVKDMSNMFDGCSSLENIDLSNFNTQNVTDMSLMFFKCSSLKKINLSNFNTKNVTDMASMFSDCSSLKSIDLSNYIFLILLSPKFNSFKFFKITSSKILISEILLEVNIKVFKLLNFTNDKY
jgi:surface protein